jgi:hypothetical protein
VGTGPGETNHLVSAAPSSTSLAVDPGVERERFRTFLERRVGGVDQAGWYLDHLRPRLALDESSRVAAEEVVDHVGRLMGFDTTRDRDEGVSTWRSPAGPRLLVAVVDAADAITGLSRATRASDALETDSVDHTVGLLCVVTGDEGREALERALAVRRVSRAVRILGAEALLALARAVARGSITHTLAAAVLSSGPSADSIVKELA